MPLGIGWQELVIVLAVMLIIFGPKRLPELGRSLGKGLREFKKSTTELQQTLSLDETAAAGDKAPVQASTAAGPQVEPVAVAPSPAAPASAAADNPPVAGPETAKAAESA